MVTLRKFGGSHRLCRTTRNQVARDKTKFSAVAWKQLRVAMLIVFIINTCSFAQDDDRQEQTKAKDPSTKLKVTQAIAELIVELDDSSFRVREKATDQLIHVGADAIPLLVKATEHESLEVAVRALRVLKELYLSGDNKTADIAESALENLAEDSKNRSIGSRAIAIKERYYEVVGRKRAIADIKRLGGEIVYNDRLQNIRTIQNDPNAGMAEIAYITLGKNWKGGEEGLKYVKRLKTLRMIYLIKGVSISEKAKGELQQALPHLQIQYRGRAYLGIAGGAAPDGMGCWITKVVERAAAHKAKLVERDVIIGFGGKPVPDFDTLIKLIGEREPNEKIKVDIVRNSTQLTLVVQLGEWGR